MTSTAVHQPLDRFDGQTAVVTGAGSGIGAATVRRLAAEGADVVCVDLDGATAGRVAAATRSTAFTADVADSHDVDALAAFLERRGSLDVLVNSAGIFDVALLSDTSDQLFERHLAVNLGSVMKLSRTLRPLLATAAKPAIVNIASVAALVGFAGNTAYSAAKGGIVSLTRTLAVELAVDRIRVNCLCPYAIEGPMIDRYFNALEHPQEQRAALEGRAPLGRLGRAEEVAAAIAFLASSDASYITGAVIPIDGGYSAA